MRQFIFTRLQEEIESLDNQVLTNYSSLFKSFRLKKYTTYHSCISSYQASEITSYTHKECLKQAELSEETLGKIREKTNKEKEKLYDCLNKVYMGLKGDLVGEKEAERVEGCLKEFKSEVLSSFEEIKGRFEN